MKNKTFKYTLSGIILSAAIIGAGLGIGSIFNTTNNDQNIPII